MINEMRKAMRQGMKIYMFVLNNCKRDARVLKEARSLARAGYQVRVIALLDKETEPYEHRDGFEIIRVVKNPVHYRLRRKVRVVRARLRRGMVLTLAYPVRKLRTRTWRSMKRGVAKNPLARAIHRIGRKVRQDLKQSFEKSFSVILGRGRWLARWWSGLKTIKSTEERGIAMAIMVIAAVFIKSLLFFKNTLTYSVRTLFTAVCGFGRNLNQRLFLVMHRPLSFLDYYIRAYRVVKEDPGHIYHAHDLNTLPVAWWAKARLGGKLVYDSHELYVETSGIGRVEKLVMSQIEKFLIRHCDAVITVNESICKELTKRYRITGPKAVIMNCPEVSLDCSETRSFHALLGLSSDIPVILYQGGFIKGRGLRNLICAMLYVPHGCLVLLGWGREEEELRLLAATLDLLGKRVFFIPPVPQRELIKWTAGANIGAITTRRTSLNNWYTLPNKLFEYIVAGIPVVASDFPELRRIIEGYKIGRTFNPEDPKDIARAIKEVLDPKSYDTFKRNVREAAKIFNWQEEEKKLLGIYSRLTGEPSWGNSS